MLVNNSSLDIIKKYFLDGPITMALFMNILSYHKDLGYYHSLSRNGIGQDFITAPEKTSFFGVALAYYLNSRWNKNFYNKTIVLLELGGGNGTLMKSILDILKNFPIYNYINVCILEISDFLRTKQASILADHVDKLTWVNDISKFDSIYPIFFIANEFFDCLPVHQFFYDYDEGKYGEIMVSYNKELDEFALTKTMKLSNAFYLLNLDQIPSVNAIIEISPASINIADYLSNMLANLGGVGIIIDYGYFDQYSCKSSIQGIQQHKVCNIFENIGRADVSAHVNFYHLASQFKLRSIELEYMNQKNFLQSCINSFDLMHYINNRQDDIDYLMNDQDEMVIGMGTLFKVMIASNFTI